MLRCLKCAQPSRVHLSITDKVHVNLCLFHAYEWEQSYHYKMGRSLALAGDRAGALYFWGAWKTRREPRAA